MSINTPKVTIVIPNHNYGKWVEKSIMSAVNDPYPDKRIVVIDDGSTDNSWPIICKTLKLSDISEGKVIEGKIGDIPTKAFRYAKAGGPSRARNTGIKIGWQETDIYGFLDSDDEYKQGRLQATISKFTEDEDLNVLGAVYSDYDTIDDEGVTRREYKEPFSRKRLIKECIVHSACMVKKECFEKVGFYDEQMRTCEDYDLWMRISECFCITHIPESLMLVRVGSHNSTATVSTEVWQKNWQRVMAKTQGRLNAR